MVIPVGPSYETQSLVLITKKEDGEILRETITLVRFVPLLREK
jgi:protein-L-isoaspartate O-methyltransferase